MMWRDLHRLLKAAAFADMQISEAVAAVMERRASGPDDKIPAEDLEQVLTELDAELTVIVDSILSDLERMVR